MKKGQNMAVEAKWFWPSIFVQIAETGKGHNKS
jgi:hypothetical protein